MYEASKEERDYLIEKYKYTEDRIDSMEKSSDSVRKGESVALMVAMATCEFQGYLKKARKATKKWWQIWK